jgi:hypothetical protein
MLREDGTENSLTCVPGALKRGSSQPSPQGKLFLLKQSSKLSKLQLTYLRSCMMLMEDTGPDRAIRVDLTNMTSHLCE